MYVLADAHHGAVAHLVHLIDGRGYLPATSDSYVLLWDTGMMFGIDLWWCRFQNNVG